MRRVVPIATLSLLAGCRVASPTVEPDSTIASVAAAPAEPTVPIVIVEQQVLTGVPSGFDPTGRIVLDSECQAWVDDGSFLGTIGDDLCAAWSDSEAMASPDRVHRARADGSSVVIEGSGPARTVACEGCAPVLALAWSPEGDRIAVLREGAERLEAWSAATLARVAEVPLGWEGQIVTAQLGWGSELTLLVATKDERPMCEDLEEYDEDADCIDYNESDGEWGAVDWSVVTYASFEAAPDIEELEAGTAAGPMPWMGSYDVISDARLDPGGRCVYYEEYDSGERESIGSRLSTVALSGDCLLEYSDEEESDEWYWSLDSTEWTEGPRPQLIAITRGSYTGPGDGGIDEGKYEIEIVELSETHRRLWSESVESVGLPSDDDDTDDLWVEMTERELLSAGAGEEVELVWKHCFTRHDDGEDSEGETGTEETEWCDLSVELPKDCEFIEMSPGHDRMLADCGDESMLTLLGEGRVELGGPELGWVWGEQWLVTVGDADGVVLRSMAAPATAKRLAPATAWVETVMGPSHDRVLLQESGSLRLVDALTGRDVERVPTTLSEVSGAALSGSGRSLALTDGATIEAIDLTGKREPHRWSALDAKVIAWRQDERAVFSGPNASAPTMAWDVRKGEPLEGAVPELGEAQLDPTWRWALSTPHRVIRMIDGLEIWFDESGVLLDDGRFEGEPEALGDIMVRLGDDPLLSPTVDPEDLGSVLRTEGLAEDFFAGRPIGTGPSTITVRQRDGFLAEGTERSARAHSAP